MAGRNKRFLTELAQHRYIGISAVVVGVALGVALVQTDTSNGSITEDLNPRSQVALGVESHIMCNPWFADCGCNQVPKIINGKKVCVDGGPKSNTNKCPPGVCVDNTNKFPTPGTCPRQNFCEGAIPDNRPKMDGMMPMMGGVPMLPMLPMPMPKMGSGVPMMPREESPFDQECKPGILSSFGLGETCPDKVGTSTESKPQTAFSFITDQISNFLGIGPAKDTPATVVEINSSTGAVQSNTVGAQISANNAGFLSGAPNQAIVTPGNSPTGMPASPSGSNFAPPASTFVSGDISANSGGSSSFASTLSSILGALSSGLSNLLGKLSF